MGVMRAERALATEQREDCDARLQTDAVCALAWLTTAARALRGRVDMAHCAVARGRPGRAHRVLPLAEADVRERADKRKAAERPRTGRPLQRGGDREQHSESRRMLIEEYQSGRLQDR